MNRPMIATATETPASTPARREWTIARGATVHGNVVRLADGTTYVSAFAVSCVRTPRGSLTRFAFFGDENATFARRHRETVAQALALCGLAA